jgi:hypothetical protein
MKKIIQKIKLWIIKMVSVKFWPKWEYKADYINENQFWVLVLKDANGILPDKIIKPKRNDLTKSSESGFYNDITFKLSSHWLFKNVRLSSGNIADVLFIPEYIKPNKYVQIFKEKGSDEARELLESTEIPLDKIVHIDLKAKSKEYLSEEDRIELKRYLISKFSE